MTTPKVIRQIGEHNWETGVNNFILNPLIQDQIISWHETGWVYSMHILNDTKNGNGNRVIIIKKNTYKLDKLPQDIDKNILDYIMDSSKSDRFIKASETQIYNIN